MIEEQIKPLSIKLTITLNIADYKKAIAKNYNVKPEEVEIIIEDDYQTSSPDEAETVAMEKPFIPPKKGEIIGEEHENHLKEYFLCRFLKELKFNREQAAELCGVGLTTINRACKGFRIRKDTFKAIVKGLELTPEQAKEFKKSLSLKQRDYHERKKK